MSVPSVSNQSTTVQQLIQSSTIVPTITNRMGDKGLTGDKGPVGDKGPTGDKGPVGDKGSTGDNVSIIDKNQNMIFDPSVLCNGKNNILLGMNVGKNIEGSNNIYIGNNALPTLPSSSNEIVLGNSSTTSLRCKQTSIAGLSDARDKTEVVPLHGETSLEFIQQLRPVEFVWDQRESYENGVSDGSKRGNIDMGFIAQDILACDNRPSYQIVSTSNPERYEVAPSRLIPLLVSAVNELSKRIALQPLEKAVPQNNQKQ